jgi:hypothetical protein
MLRFPGAGGDPQLIEAADRIMKNHAPVIAIGTMSPEYSLRRADGGLIRRAT